MAIEGPMNKLKYLVFFFNFLFWLSGLALIIVGAVVKDKYGDFMSFADQKYADAAVFLIVVGIIVFIIAFLGCCGSIKENYCMMTSFAVLLTIIFVLEIAAGALGFAYRNSIESYADKALRKGIDNYKTDAGAKQFYDKIQKELSCCGITGSSDWTAKNSTFIPKSCCKDNADQSDCVKTPSNLYSKGCKAKFEQFIRDNLVIVGGIGIGAALLQILGIIFACCLIRELRDKYEVV